MVAVVANWGRGPGSSMHFKSLPHSETCQVEKCFNNHMTFAFKDWTKFCVTILEFRISPMTSVELKRIFSSFHP